MFVVLMSAPLSIYIYCYPVFFLIFKLASLPIFLVTRIIWFANVVGRGKGLSGIGLTMALYEVLNGML